MNLLLLCLLLYGLLGESMMPNRPAVAHAAEVAQEAGTVISYTPEGFTPSKLSIGPGDTVIWRNTTGAALALRSGSPHQIFLPQISAQEAAGSLAAGASGGSAMPSLAATTAFDTIVAPGGEFSFQFMDVGAFPFFDASQPAFSGTITVIADAAPIARCEDIQPAETRGVEEELPGLLYATAPDRTLLRWYWSDCTNATFAVYRSENGGREQLVATVTPVTDPVAATRLLNTTDARWPELASHFDGRLLTAHDLTDEQHRLDVTELYHYLYTNSLAGIYLTNQYYPLALMLGWGYLDTDMMPGASYTYRVEAVEGGAGGGPLALGQVELSAGQRTPLPAPTGLVSGTLDLEPWQGDWGSYQRNRRYDGQIYLNWSLDNGLAADDPLAPALTIGYDVFRATDIADNGSITTAEKVVPPDAKEPDAIVVPGPMSAGEGPEYLFRYAPDNYQQHTFCVAPRDLLNQPIRWPEDAARCSAPVTVAARDYLPPAVPEDVRASAQENSAQVQIRWSHPTPADVSRFIVQRTKEMHCETGDCWTDVATVAGNSTSWTDLASPCANDPLTDEGCWYRVVARDAAGNRSAPSQAVYAINYDTLPPTDLELHPFHCGDGSGPNTLNCVDIVTPAVSIRVNCRLSPDGTELFIAEIDADDYIGLNLPELIRGVYQPPLHLEGVACRFILADEYGNLSDIDDSPVIPVVVLSDNPDQLAQPVINEIETRLEAPGDWAAIIQWEIAAHPMLAGFVIEREHNGAVQEFDVNDPAARSFNDTDVELGVQYTYIVRSRASAPGVNETVSEPRSHRILPGEERPLTELAWSATTPDWDAATASTTLLVQSLPVAEQGLVHYAVFRSLQQDRDYLQITPILATTEGAIFYVDEQAQRGCYSYVVVTFRQRDGEPNGYTEPRQPDGCAEAIPATYTPRPDQEPPAPGLLCAPAAHSLAPDYNFRFGGGFQVVIESLADDHTGPARVDGTGWLLLETAEESIYAPMNFSGLTVDATGRVCSGTATVDLTTLPDGGLNLQVPGGWRYRLRTVTLQPLFLRSNTALATLDLLTGDAFTSHDGIGESATQIELEDAQLMSSLRFTYAADMAQQAGHSCETPSVAFHLETLPLEVIPTGQLSIDEFSIEVGSACTRYLDRYTTGITTVVSPPLLGPGPRRSLNDGYLAAPMAGSAVSLTPAGLDGNFTNGAALEWYTAYPFAFRVQADGVSLSIADGQIVAGSMGAGNLRTSYHQTAGSGDRAIIQSQFSGLTIGSRGDLTGVVSLGEIRWDAFSMPAGGSWTYYQGALTTPGLPAFHDTDGHGQTIMWQASPGGATPVAILDGTLPGLLEPGLNRRQTGTTLEWANCGSTARFTNVAVDAYLRHSGLTQRHIPLYDTGSTMEVYGYDFIPERFDLHFLDNALLEHEISGVVDLPFPSDIAVQLVDIWLTGDLADPVAGEAACIGGGRIPEGEQDQTLAYWGVDTRFTSAEFRQGMPETVLWFLGDLRNLPHLRVGTGAAILPAELAFDPDGNFHDDPQSGPKLDRPDYTFQGFPYLVERFRLSDWLGSGQGEVPAWEPGATAINQPAAALWNISGFVGLRGVPIAPYYGPIAIDAGPAGDNMVMAAWEPNLTGFAAQPRVSKEWVKLARVNITFDYDHLVHVYDVASGTGLFAGFKAYRFVPDSYALPAVVPDLPLTQLQVLQLDTGTVIAPTETSVYLGLSSGVATLRALAQAQGLAQPELPVLETWADRMAIGDVAAPVYIAQLALAVQQHGPFDYRDTTDMLDALSDANLANLLDEEQVGGRTQGLLAERGVNIRRLRGVVEMEGLGLEAQFARFQLSTQVEIKGRNQSAEELVSLAPLPANPAVEPDPPLFYAERMTLSIERHGDITLVGMNVQSSTFKENLDAFDATLVINATQPQFEGGLTLYGLETGSITIGSASAVLGVGAEVNYLGLSFDGSLRMGLDEATVGGELLAGVVDPESLVLQNNFADVMDQIAGDLTGEVDVGNLSTMSGFYLRAYGGQIPIMGNSCILSLKADAEVAFWYWKVGGGENAGGLLKPAVYGEVLCVVQARGALRLEYHVVDGQDSFVGEGYVAGGIGKCEPSSWGSWGERWWGDGACLQAGAGLAVVYNGADGWSVEYDIDAEGLIGD